MKVAICDDTPIMLEYVIEQVADICPTYETMPFNKIAELFQAVKDGVVFHVVLMDIEWDGADKDGIDFASELYSLSPKTKIIFITGYPVKYSQQIFLKNINLRGFVSKPIDLNILHNNLDRIRDELSLEESRKLTLKFNNAVISIYPDDILYIESRAHTATVHAIDGGHLCYEKLGDLAKRLPMQFILTHKSFFVNMDKIKLVERERVILEKGMEVPISKARYGQVRDDYFRYVGLNI